MRVLEKARVSKICRTFEGTDGERRVLGGRQGSGPRASHGVC